MDSAGKPNHVRGSSVSQCFPKSSRIHSPREFDQLFRDGKVLADAVLVMHASAKPPDLSSGRLGISISKRVGCAPLRNRWKRLIREAYRKHARQSRALIRLDIVVRPRRGAVPDYWAIERSLLSLAHRLEKQLNKSLDK